MYDIKTAHHNLKCDPFEFVKSKFDPEHHEQYLVFDRDSSLWSDALHQWHWSGVRVNPNSPNADTLGGQTYIAAHVGPDDQIKLLMEGFYVRMITVKEIFNQFSGPYDVIVMANTGRDRELWQSDSIFNALPKVYVLAEDGNNKGVIETAWDRGYVSHVSGKWLVLVHR